MSTFLGKESTFSVKVVKLFQESESTFFVWVSKCKKREPKGVNLIQEKTVKITNNK